MTKTMRETSNAGFRELSASELDCVAGGAEPAASIGSNLSKATSSLASCIAAMEAAAKDGAFGATLSALNTCGTALGSYVDAANGISDQIVNALQGVTDANQGALSGLVPGYNNSANSNPNNIVEMTSTYTVVDNNPGQAQGTCEIIPAASSGGGSGGGGGSDEEYVSSHGDYMDGSEES